MSAGKKAKDSACRMAGRFEVGPVEVLRMVAEQRRARRWNGGVEIQEMTGFWLEHECVCRRGIRGTGAR